MEWKYNTMSYVMQNYCWPVFNAQVPYMHDDHVSTSIIDPYKATRTSFYPSMHPCRQPRRKDKRNKPRRKDKAKTNMHGCLLCTQGAATLLQSACSSTKVQGNKDGGAQAQFAACMDGRRRRRQSRNYPSQSINSHRNLGFRLGFRLE